MNEPKFTELKPCPFCGAKPILMETNQGCHVQCLKCRVQNWRQHKRVVIKLWNIRTGEEPTRLSEIAKENHCKDCCCAESWKALGIKEYTGKSIPEHIAELRKKCHS